MNRFINRKRVSFTVLELVIVIVIMSILIVAAIPRRQSTVLHEAREEIALIYNKARQMSMAENPFVPSQQAASDAGRVSAMNDSRNWGWGFWGAYLTKEYNGTYGGVPVGNFVGRRATLSDAWTTTDQNLTGFDSQGLPYGRIFETNRFKKVVITRRYVGNNATPDGQQCLGRYDDTGIGLTLYTIRECTIVYFNQEGRPVCNFDSTVNASYTTGSVPMRTYRRRILNCIMEVNLTLGSESLALWVHPITGYVEYR